MNKPNTIEKDLDKIRVDYYEKTKGMTATEKNAYIKAQVAPIHQKYGYKLIKKVPQKVNV